MAEQLPTGKERRHIPRTWSGEFTFKRFGVQTHPRESRPSANIVPVEILGNNPNRLFYSVMNRSNVNVALGFSVDVTEGNGLLIPPNGGWASQAIQDDGTAVAWAVYAASAVDGAELYIYEILGG